jgi:hypothetical protein
MNVYRIYPTLWNDGICKTALTVYAIDRTPLAIPTACSRRPSKDPSYYWDAPIFQRLLPSESMNIVNQAITWSTLPQWISFAIQQGYIIKGEIKPNSDFYIEGR